MGLFGKKKNKRAFEPKVFYLDDIIFIFQHFDFPEEIIVQSTKDKEVLLELYITDRNKKFIQEERVYRIDNLDYYDINEFRNVLIKQGVCNEFGEVIVLECSFGKNPAEMIDNLNRSKRIHLRKKYARKK